MSESVSANSTHSNTDRLDVRIAGTGVYLPGPPRNTTEVRRFLGRYPDRLPGELRDSLLTRSGIKTRHFAVDFEDETVRETNADLSVAAAKEALEAAGWGPQDVEFLLVSTVIPDQLIPPTSVFVQEKLGILECAEIEISANCTAPFKALLIATDAIRAGRCRRALVCMSQCISFLGRSPWVNPATMGDHHGALRWIVSDGAAAIALEGASPGNRLQIWTESAGFGRKPGMSLALGTAYPDILNGFSRGDHHVRQDDRRVLKEGVPLALAAVEKMLTASNIDPTAIAHFLPGIASVELARKLQDLFEKHLQIPAQSWRLDIDRAGYLGGVGSFATLDRLRRQGILKSGEIVCGFVEESSKWMAAGFCLVWI